MRGTTSGRTAWQTRTFITCWALTAVYNVAWGVVFPLRNLYFREPWVGLSFEQIGWLGFVRSLAMAGFPVIFGILSDRSGRRKPWIMGGFALSCVLSIFYLLGRDFWQFTFIVFIATAGFVAYNLNVSALVTMTLAKHARGRQFGLYRVSGSVGFGIATFALIPLVARDSTYTAVFAVGSAVYFVCIIIAQVGLREAPANANGMVRWDAWRGALKHRNLVVLYSCFAFGAIGTSMGFQFFSNHLDETFGMSKAAIGRMTSLQSFLEIPALILLGSFSDKWGRKPILVASFFAGGLRWAAVGLAPTAAWIIPAQALWGIGFSGFTVGVALITDLVDDDARGSALGLFQLSWAAGNIIGPPIGGYIAENLGLPLVFRIGSAFSIVAAFGLLFLLKNGSTHRPQPEQAEPS